MFYRRPDRTVEGVLPIFFGFGRTNRSFRDMTRFGLMIASALSGALLAWGGSPTVAYAQTSAATEAPAAAPAVAETAPEPLSDEELEILVARIALYPDELVAVIAAASLYPIEIIEAARYLDQVKTKPDLKPKSDWDGSVVSLLNYPDIVKMMSDDLDWTQALGEALANQQKDVLAAIQQLRDKAVAEGIIKTDEKVKVVREKDTIVIQPAKADVVYVPQYEPAMLYDPGYAYEPVSYYPTAYAPYYSPIAPYFAGVVTGAIWAGMVDWNGGGVWGGSNWGNDINIDCNKCFNNVDFSGKVNMNNVDWKNVDRSKINFDRNQLTNIDNSKFKDSLKGNANNNLKNKAAGMRNERATTLPGKGGRPQDIRKSTLEGLNKKGGINNKLPGAGGGNKLGGAGAGINNSLPGGGKADLGNATRQAGKPRPAARPDARPKNPSPLGDVSRGRDAKTASNRGNKSMGGGLDMGGGGRSKVSGGGGNRSMGGGGGGGRKYIKRGGGGRGGGGRGGRR
jgi:hypothetical protein